MRVIDQHPNRRSRGEAMFFLPRRPQVVTYGLKEAFQFLDADAKAIGGARNLLAAIVTLQLDTQTPGNRSQCVVVHHPVRATHYRI